MSQLLSTELRLTKVIHEGRDLLLKMKEHRVKLQELQVNTAPAHKALKAEIVKTIAEVLEKEKSLKAEIDQAVKIANNIETHYVWKNAVRAIWGDDGVELCIEKMQAMQLVFGKKDGA